MASLYVPSRIGSPTGNGYKLYFYQTGTTTPQNTYSQSDLAPGHENTNPVVADADGLFGPIYLLASPDYKAILKDASGTTIWTTDPLLVASSTVITTEGDLIVGDSNGEADRLPIGPAATYLRSDGTDPSWEELDLRDADENLLPIANMPAGTIIQTVYAEYKTYTAIAGQIPRDDTIPQIGEGTQILTASITPTSTTNKIMIYVQGQASIASDDVACIAVFRGASANAIASCFIAVTSGAPATMLSLATQDSPASVAAQAYTVRAGTGTPVNLFFNGESGARRGGGTSAVTLILQELVA